MTRKLPRRLHAGAWWLWALGLMAVATQTTNPLLLGLVVAVCGVVVARRRGGAAWAGGYRAYLVVAAVVVAIRIFFRTLFGGGVGADVLFHLPRLSIPGGLTVGGPVTAQQVLAGMYDGFRLAAILVCVGAANTLADPRRLARSLPAALSGVATSVVVALSLAPQLVESFARIRRARRLRGESGTGWRSLRPLLVPLAEETLHRSVSLAASMEGRGYGRPSPSNRKWGAVAIGGLAPLAVGSFWLVTGSETVGATATVGAGAVLVVGGIAGAGNRDRRTRYRADRWERQEWLVGLSGVVAAVGVYVTAATTTGVLAPTLDPLTWPQLSPVAAISVLVAATPAVTAPPTPPVPSLRSIPEAAQ
ncbi:MAG: CbiQ family ECF transporter T component [Actinomycetes bacterium]|nr:energy-coupling factor transporter transmembrane protein EcfT [Acidimicrobiia bacterium]